MLTSRLLLHQRAVIRTSPSFYGCRYLSYQRHAHITQPSPLRTLFIWFLVQHHYKHRFMQCCRCRRKETSLADSAMSAGRTWMRVHHSGLLLRERPVEHQQEPSPGSQPRCALSPVSISNPAGTSNPASISRPASISSTGACVQHQAMPPPCQQHPPYGPTNFQLALASPCCCPAAPLEDSTPADPSCTHRPHSPPPPNAQLITLPLPRSCRCLDRPKQPTQA